MSMSSRMTRREEELEEAGMSHRYGPYLRTQNGRFYYLDNRPEDYDIRDVARSLSRTGRYSNMCPGFYTVAQHSCIVYWILQGWDEQVEVQYQGLMHDYLET